MVLLDKILDLYGPQRNMMLLLLGCFATLALPPFYWLPLLIPSLTGLYLFASHSATQKRSVADGWWWGLGYFVSGLYWFAYPLLIEPEKFGWLIPFAILGISAILALYIGIATGIFARISKQFPQHVWLSWIVFALCFGLMEWLRAHLFTGFPWNLIGYSWTITDTAIQGGWYLGVYGLGILTVLVSTLPILLLKNTTSGSYVYSASLGLLVLFFVMLGARLPDSTLITDKNNSIKLRLVQGNIPQSLKWDPQGRLDAVNIHSKLSLRDGHENLDAIIWAESAMGFSFTSGDQWAKRLATITPKEGVLITGVTRYVQQTDTPYLYNSIQVLDNNAQVTAIYDKRKLVPFGEFIPLRWLIPLEKKITHGMLDFTPGEGNGVVTSKTIPNFLSLICYEAIFPELVTDTKNAKWILNITNDAWFGDSTAPHQHLQMSRMRAVEAGLPMARVANSGITTAYDSYGRALGQIPLNTQNVIDITLPLKSID